ncbi:nuclear autoantigen Sp-100 isoform 1 [Rattus norvegicus]|uniref:nuclear autoantigen Sp-100 isoform 1 n=1 Tax=Rattus norvegicus TaxID=10116 RepID=UPI001917439A|nr:nuclear autoantigen Sp-100 isoform 1 [Rattus norvegicus]
MEGNSFSSRMSSEHENTETFPFELIFQHFKRQKVAISNAIKNPFPFLEGLRDHELITAKMYEDLQDSYRALVRVQEVIYRALDKLEKIFSMKVLYEVFSNVNMEKYPDLQLIYQSFERVLPNGLCFQRSDGGDPNSQLSLEQGPNGSCSQATLTLSPFNHSFSDGWGSNDRLNSSLTHGNQSENHQLPGSPNHLVSSLEDGLSETVQTSRVRREATTSTTNNTNESARKCSTLLRSPGSVLEDACEFQVQLNNRDASPEPYSLQPSNEERAVQLNHDLQINPCSVRLVDIKKENISYSLDDNQQTQARTNENQGSEIIELSSDEDSNDEINLSEASTLILSKPETAHSRQPPTPRTYRRGDTSDTSSSSLDRRRKRTGHTIAVGNNPVLGRDGGRRRKKRERHGNYLIRNIKIPMNASWKTAFGTRHSNPSSQQGRKRGPRIHKDVNADFSSNELLVTCGKVVGTLYKEKLNQGIHVKSIQSTEGKWFTPLEFEIEGGYEKCKNWRQSIRCSGWPLKELIKRGELQDPPRKTEMKETPPNSQQRKRKRKLKNLKACKVCGQRRRVRPCATCRKCYHKNCHIPPVEVQSGPWHCAFCKTRNQLRCQENQACHKESEVLKRKMSPEEQLKCELLLLTIYCCPKSGFFIRKPKKRKEDFPDLQEHMWLNKIKHRLNKKAYHSVQHFVGDMRLIFQNHSKFYKSRFKNLGVIVGNKFEKTFKSVFSIEDTSKQLQPSQHTVLLT